MGRLKALIVDDSPTLRHHVVGALAGIPGLSCTEAADGAEGIRRLGGETFDLIITDLQMPILNGFALIQYLRGRPETRAIPIVVVTAAGTDDDRKKLEEAGVTAVLRKPFEANQLLGLARKLLPQLEAGASP
jgi:two-component system chemotaxis response regulator CheY